MKHAYTMSCSDSQRNQWTTFFCLEPTAIAWRMSQPSGKSGRPGIFWEYCRDRRRQISYLVSRQEQPWLELQTDLYFSTYLTGCQHFRGVTEFDSGDGIRTRLLALVEHQRAVLVEDHHPIPPVLAEDPLCVGEVIL